MSPTMLSSPTTDPEPSQRLEDEVISTFLTRHPGGDADLLRRAFAVADRGHQGQTRKSGEPYIHHPISVTAILAEYGMDAATLAAAILHDTVEDTDITLPQITEEFGAEIAYLIDGVTKLDRIQYDTREQAQAATIRKMVVAMAQDLRVLLIKLADRLHNIRTVGALRLEKQQRVAGETLDVYTPLAHRLGVQEIKHELEDSCFRILYPGPYAEIKAKLDERAPEREVFLEKVMAEITSMLDEAEVEAQVSGRPKHEYSIYRKMVESGRPFEDIHDLIGIRIVTQSVQGCYGALGLVHARWVPISGRFKDYIAMPKFNLYQSLHTTVVGPDGKPLEVQIRTEEMHRLAESGVAAHWRYKEGPEAASLDWVGKLPSLDDDFADPEEFLAQLKLDLYQDEVFVLTPLGDVKSLPRGSTAVDFAFAVHTEVGYRCVGSKVNGRLVPLSTKLSSGDIVEIITSRSQDAGPSRDWLNFVITSRAKSKIKGWFLKERRDQAAVEGRDDVMSLLRKEGLGLGAAERESILSDVASDFNRSDVDGLMAAVGENEISAQAVVNRVVRMVRPAVDEEDLLAPVRPRKYSSGGPGVIVEGLDDMLVRIARCCAPVPGDGIVGFVTVGRGVSVHRSDCTNIAALQSDSSERMVEVMWAPDRVGSFTIWVQVEALDRTKLLRDVTSAISDMGGNITASSSVTGRDRVAILRYEIELSDPGMVSKLIADLRGVDGVYAAFRLVSDPGD
ncbi:MAG: bifunctional (p)ppGpp synthetase/guanosine-3',5'-bis(diphosphate) 3'-pyrophosphohydrolase [Acidimicrobiia bacterium]|nr:bifunctional (p)ppGpp synthetase/guanosine-3',5'-bis(diphosphate) 3'-pyrophosphohydrolase [Acidimicrobiia bacterium]MDH4306350.1 bifunctional (p)ppGpp synthetase/guanosine-3',5'-bis(diphosphate) 3'-pyrophosphohydrolase [Acidimicrobiia bacterium]